jgi:two-component system, NarL family, sensor histidine kinase UhpB
MKVASPPLYAKVCLINGAVFAAALTLLVVSPATVAHQVTAPELAVLAAGLAVIVVTNAAASQHFGAAGPPGSASRHF